MMRNRPTWARLLHVGLPALFVTRPLRGYTGAVVGDPYPAPEPRDKKATHRARLLYDRGCIGIESEMLLVKARLGAAALKASAANATAGKVKENAGSIFARRKVRENRV